MSTQFSICCSTAQASASTTARTHDGERLLDSRGERVAKVWHRLRQTTETLGDGLYGERFALPCMQLLHCVQLKSKHLINPIARGSNVLTSQPQQWHVTIVVII